MRNNNPCSLNEDKASVDLACSKARIRFFMPLFSILNIVRVPSPGHHATMYRKAARRSRAPQTEY